MNRFAQMRARHALDAAGLDPATPLEPANSVTNEVWVGHELVVRVNSQPNDRLRREAALARQLPAEVAYPRVIASGGDVGADYLIVERVPGHPLSRWWPGLSRDQRREAIAQLAGRLRAVHTTVASSVPPLTHTPQLIGADREGRVAVQPLLEAVDRAARLDFVDRGVLADVKVMVVTDADHLTPFDSPTLIHGDLTFENVLYDGHRITALLDFEWARPGPPDLDLDVLLRFCAFPHLHVAADYESKTRADDYRLVPWWLAEDYPELFDAPYVFERVRLYGIAWDIAELLEFPPRVDGRSLPPEHPYHRLRRAVGGSGHLDALDRGVRVAPAL